ncbi:MAG: hypothetical protein F6K26_31820 [Moorea sp. SIO2I5]|nr:hypothetical protein [Moorena sp. SIO2I5]
MSRKHSAVSNQQSACRVSANALQMVLLEVLSAYGRHSVVRTAWPKAKACATLIEVLLNKIS